MTLAEPGELIFFLSVLIDGVLAGAIYGLIAVPSAWCSALQRRRGA